MVPYISYASRRNFIRVASGNIWHVTHRSLNYSLEDLVYPDNVRRDTMWFTGFFLSVGLPTHTLNASLPF